MKRWLNCICALTVLAACAPRAGALRGVPVTRSAPATPLVGGHQRLVFRWSYDDALLSARGEGVARIAPPDSVRLDFFLDGGMGGGAAVLIDDSLRTPEGDDGSKYLPSVNLLWATLGVLRVAGGDTLVRLDGDTLRIQTGDDPVWRAAFHGTTLSVLERIVGGKIRERVVRSDSTVSYRQFTSRRRLSLTVTRRFSDPPFDAAIWR